MMTRLPIAALVSTVLALSVTPALSCGGGSQSFASSMTREAGQTSALYSEPYFASRHERAVEYALENEVFIDLIEEAALKASLSAGFVPPNATDIVLAIRSQIKRIEYARAKGLDIEFWSSSVAEVVEVVLTQTVPVIDAPLTAAKIATAFSTAYAYGFLFG